MKKIIVLFIFGLQHLISDAQNLNLSDYHTYYSNSYNKIIKLKSVLYIINTNEGYLFFTNIKEEKLFKTEISLSQNSIGSPFSIYNDSYFGIKYDLLNYNIYKRNNIQEFDLANDASIFNILPLNTYYDNYIFSRRNLISYIDRIISKKVEVKLLKNVIKLDFFLTDSNFIDIFVRDNLRFSWWRTYGNIKSDSMLFHAKSEEIKTYTFLDKDSPDLAFYKETEYSPKKYSYNAFDDTTNTKRLSNYGFKMMLLHFLPQNTRDSLLQDYFSRKAGYYSSYQISPMDDIEQQLDSTFKDLFLRFSPFLNKIDTVQNPRLDRYAKPFSKSQKDTLNKYINSYAEPNFFLGNFKVIRQDENYFIINEHYRDIYYLSDEKVIKIGQVKYINNEKQLNRKKCFIEDRDNNQLIFFAPVEWYRKDYPLPNIRIITGESEFDKIFELLENENN